MAVPTESLINFTLEKMQQRLISQNATTSGMVKSVQSGLIFAGNIHDSIPRQLLLDSRLSPIDKIAWMMIRLYALKNDGAVFPTYDELQVQLASSTSEKASRETVSRAILMLRITGWLSLCKRVRDSSGCIRGNIYMQHDEPISAFDAETLDPYWLDTLERACKTKNKGVRNTAISILQEVKDDPFMKHQHSRIKIIENRLGVLQSPKQLVVEKNTILDSEILPQTKNRTKLKTLSSKTELSKKEQEPLLSSNSELSNKSTSYVKNGKSNCYVRNITHSVKETYGSGKKSTKHLSFSDRLSAQMSEKDKVMLLEQLTHLPTEQTNSILNQLESGVLSGSVKNVVAYGLTLLKSAREGRYSYTIHSQETQKILKNNTDNPIDKVEQTFKETKDIYVPDSEKIREQISHIKKRLIGR
ncbi:STY4528 family pathogenicity island replication protein [Xenorhabdus khoisanae]|uniref:STY4528 family pathogenicity island replication protein n=1 Tax=Xenorhabdus khoisanae TaxID=880157 RepID=UPI00235837A8|nr:STY4528 family pathogenicity island replication protein [Xenorhabdus khoisanae]MDC9612939.1 STY4528 family pathogenicity island replication protein [Xenorhabdus khoisanae]